MSMEIPCINSISGKRKSLTGNASTEEKQEAQRKLAHFPFLFVLNWKILTPWRKMILRLKRKAEVAQVTKMKFKTREWKIVVSSPTLVNELGTRQEGPLQLPRWEQCICVEASAAPNTLCPGNCPSGWRPLVTVEIAWLLAEVPRIQTLPT